MTLKDIAREAGVSYQTVSKVLHGKIQVTPEVRARVERVAEELGYRPNIRARSLRTQASQLIGFSWEVGSTDQMSPMTSSLLQSIVEASRARGYHVLLFPQPSGQDQQDTYRDLTRVGQVDGFVLSDVGYDDPRVPLLRKVEMPFVVFGRSTHNCRFPYVDVDSQQGIYQATWHLIAQGHRRIALLGWPETSRESNDRVAGYFQAVQEAGLPVGEAWIIRRPGGFEFGYSATCDLLDLDGAQRPTAIVAVFDLIAVGAMYALLKRGLWPGRDLALTGYGDLTINQYPFPGLTTLQVPIRQIGQQLVRVLMGLIHGQGPMKQQILIPPRLVIRESSQGWRPER